MKKNNEEKVSMVKGIKIHINMCCVLNNKCLFPAFVKEVALIVSAKDMFAIDRMVWNSFEEVSEINCEYKLESFSLYSSSIYIK